MKVKVCFNGEFYPFDAPLLTAQNRSFKWGDGLFETMKVFEGRILSHQLHFERLFISLQLLQIKLADYFTKEKIVTHILELCKQNNCIDSSRIRLAVYREENNSAGYLIEALPLDKKNNEWQEEGQSLILFPYTRKSMDAFANIKSANFLPYIMAQRFAVENKVDDAIILNAHNRICDSSKANIFFIKGNDVFTPSLLQGCINGVMRRVVIEEVKKMGYRFYHDAITEQQLLDADEVFLTNAIQLIRWVKKYKNSHYTYIHTKKIFDAVSATIFSEAC